MNNLQLFVPGRICLFGEHSDWAGGHRRTNAKIEKGYALIVGTNQGIYAEVSAHPNKLSLSSTKPNGEQLSQTLSMKPEVLKLAAQVGDFWSYIAGVAYQVQKKYKVKGLKINNFKTDLPVKKGLSSSAAISVLTARAFNQIYNLKLTINEEMELAYQGEITTPSRCGRMDQGCAFGNQPVLMQFDADKLNTTPIKVGGNIHLVIVDLHGHKDTKKILSDLNTAYPFPRTEQHRGLHKLLGAINKKIVSEAVEVLKQGSAEQLGNLMTKAQASFDMYAQPLSPEELSSPKLHQLLTNEKLKPYIWGGKGVGSQGDGTAQFIAKSQRDQQHLIEVIEKEFKLTTLPLTIFAN